MSQDERKTHYSTNPFDSKFAGDSSRTPEDPLSEDERELLKITLASIGDAVICTDATGRVTFLNAVASHLTGWPEQEAFGQSLPTVFKIINEATRKEVTNPALRAIEQGVIVELANHTILVARDGQERPIDDSAAPIRNRDGKTIGAVLVFRDVTERKKTENRLRELEHRNRSILESIDDSFYVVDADWRFTYVNQRALTYMKKTQEEILGKVVWDVFPEARGSIFEAQFRRSVKERRPITFEAKSLFSHRWLEVHLYPASGPDISLSVYYRDVTDRWEASQALLRSEERNRTILESITDAFVAVDQNWQFTYVNRMAEKLLDQVAPQLLGKNVWDAYPGAKGTDFEKAFRKAADEGLASTVIQFYPDHNRWYEVHTYPSSTGISIYFRNVTEQKQAEAKEKALQLEAEESNAKFRAFFEQGTLFAAIMHTDGTILEPNRMSWESCGFSRDQIVGKPFWKGPWWSPSPSLSQKLREALQQAARGNTFRSEVPYFIADGTTRIADVSIRPIKDEIGRIKFLALSGMDVTDRKRAEENLARLITESERQRRLYDTILSNTPDLVYVFDLNHRFIYANKALLDMWGRTLEESLGKNCLELGYEPWHAEMHDREIEQVIATKKPIRGDVPFSGTQGRRIYDYIFVPVLAADGEVEAIAGTTRDVTERKLMEDALRKADRTKDDFLALLAHELRNPLAPLRNGLQVLSRSDDRKIRATTQEIMDRQLTHMVRLVDDLLDLSRISRNRMELKKSRIFFEEIIRSAVETVRPIIDSAGHHLEITLPEEAFMLEADLTRLAQVFSNLLANSSKYTNPGGLIRLLARKEKHRVNVRVEDNGIGIPASAFPTLFEMFSQVDGSNERSQGGLGIGLALVKGLVEMHGGTVSVESDGPGKGSTFLVSLPILVLELEPQKDRFAMHGTPKSQSRKILVVDDNRDSAVSMSMMLQLLGDEVQVAHDGLEAVEAAKNFHPEIILMDIGMPRMNGYEATRRIREQTRGENIVIVALSGWGQEGDKAQSKNAGCDGHLIKPVELADLEMLLSKLTQR
ncbi:PAS domain-containing protein [Telmatocola sphagniphila]|uniref:histidine kinase n=1 Tax=Telmatocola sphagniphila TaxID=1123043 RepID=A0A8E6B3Y7_9BACT|nr:PAS domain-containing protein [Telmatocola sphagniphila]QVL29930.1 PAS domain-containing protein [Telmatocola sphagniphila]